jgi:hypothetical protein
MVRHWQSPRRHCTSARHQGPRTDRSALPAVPLRSPVPGTARNRREQPTAEPQCLRGYSRVFPAVPGKRTYRGEGFRLTLLCHFSPFCGPCAVQIPDASRPERAVLASLAFRCRSERAWCRFEGETGAVARGSHLLEKGARRPSAVHAESERQCPRPKAAATPS